MVTAGQGGGTGGRGGGGNACPANVTPRPETKMRRLSKMIVGIDVTIFHLLKVGRFRKPEEASPCLATRGRAFGIG